MLVLKKKDSNNIFISIIIITLGCLFMALGTAIFLLPNKLSSGGFAGIATIIYYLFDVKIGTSILALNIPLFVLSFFRNGKELFLKSIYGTFFFSVFLNYIEKRSICFTQDKLLASIYGGILIGIGTALILRENGSTGGTDLLTYEIRSFFNHFKPGKLILIIDAIIVLLNVLIFKEIEIGLYSFVAIYIVGKMIDIVFEGIYFTKMIYIISSKSEVISNRIGEKIERGSTGIYSKGMYNKNNGIMLLCVATRNEVEKIKKIALEEDESAFIIVTNAREVRGKGF